MAKAEAPQGAFCRPQTQRRMQHVDIGIEEIPNEVTHIFGAPGKGAAQAPALLTSEQFDRVVVPFMMTGP